LLLLEFHFSLKRALAIKICMRGSVSRRPMCYQHSFSGNIQSTWENVHKPHAIRIVAVWSRYKTDGA